MSSRISTNHFFFESVLLRKFEWRSLTYFLLNRQTSQQMSLKHLSALLYNATNVYYVLNTAVLMTCSCPIGPWICSFRLWHFINHLLTYLLTDTPVTRWYTRDTGVSATEALLLAEDRLFWWTIATAGGSGWCFASWWWWWLLIICCYQGSHAESPGFFSLNFQDVESPGKSLWSWKVLEKYPWKLCVTVISRISSTKFGQLILSKIVEIVATRCHILRLKCTKFDLSWDPMLRELTALAQIP